MKRPEPVAAKGVRLLPAVFCILLLASCAGAPKIFVPPDENRELSLLPGGGKVYLWADVAKSRPLLEELSFEGLSVRDAAPFLDSAETAAIVLFPDGHSRRFFLAAMGNFPVSKANFSLTFSRDWKKQKSSNGNSFWYSKKDEIALSLTSNLAIASNTDPFYEVDELGVEAGNFPRALPPPGFLDFRRDLVLAAWMPSPQEAIAELFEAIGIPIQIPAEEFFFGAAFDGGREEEPWQLISRTKTLSASQARSVVTLFSIARRFVQQLPTDFNMGPLGASALLLANIPEQDGEILTLRSAFMGESHIALLLSLFPL